MIGNLADARRAVLGDFPEIGSGTGRRCFRKPGDDVVYKVEHYHGQWSQDSEMRTWTRLQSMDIPDSIGIPELTQYTVTDVNPSRPVVVNAMTYIEGKHSYIEDDHAADWLIRNRIDDTHARNVIKDVNGIYWIVDLEI